MEKARGRTLGAGQVDMAKVDATTELDTRRHMVEDGLDPDNPLAGFTPVSRVAEVRRKAGMSQDAFARSLCVPVKTIRNWEQGRSKPDPAARALLAIVDDDPARCFQVLKRRITSIGDYVEKPLPQHPKFREGPKRRPSREVVEAADKLAGTVARKMDATLKKL